MDGRCCLGTVLSVGGACICFWHTLPSRASCQKISQRLSEGQPAAVDLRYKSIGHGLSMRCGLCCILHCCAVHCCDSAAKLFLQTAVDHACLNTCRLSMRLRTFPEEKPSTAIAGVPACTSSDRPTCFGVVCTHGGHTRKDSLSFGLLLYVVPTGLWRTRWRHGGTGDLLMEEQSTCSSHNQSLQCQRAPYLPTVHKLQCQLSYLADLVDEEQRRAYRAQHHNVQQPKPPLLNLTANGRL